ncbi:protein of unknown function [Nitrospira japonica]|uniref:Uncharacterized protein n=1 Tax=Nitrospira japonica TaxID=1325564 RepID=A0A1W1I5I7_9BACT|nr:HEAT repeat domain-containing protein [Nitrospira japonica]SLM48093.1 protein of unknown function [Nitrospira japonica]
MRSIVKAKRKRKRTFHTRLTQVDPTSTIIVHGTWANDEDWWRWGAEFPAYLDQHTNDVYKGADFFSWSGGVSHKDRTEGGKALQRWVVAHPTEKLRIVAHSHGGNVAFLASHDGLKIHTLILLGTPIRTDYSPSMKNIRYIYNVYSPDDGWQTAGAEPYPRGEGKTKGQILPEASDNLKVGGSHFDLHTSSLWKNYKLERIIGTLSTMSTDQELVLRQELLILRLREGDRQERLEAILDLARMMSTNAAPVLRERLENDEPSIQIYAAYALHRIAGDKRGVPILLYYLQGPNKDLREGAVYALGLMGKGILPDLRAALAKAPHSASIRRIMHEVRKQ